MTVSDKKVIEPENNKIFVNGINLNYFDWGGDGPVMVLLHGSHGSTSFGRMWDFTARLLHPDYRILALDQRGFGDSDKPQTGYASEDYAADLAAFVDALGIAPFILVGKSMGGRVAQTYGGLYPDKVSHIVLVNGPHYVSLFSDPEAAERFRKGSEAMRVPQTTFPSEDEAIKQLSDRYAERGGETVLRHDLKYNTNRKPDGRLEWKYDNNARAESHYHIPDNLTSYVKRITCPVLFAVAENNQDMSGERLHHAESLFSNVVSVKIANSSHDPQTENPVETARVIREFLAK
ncbi:alpha/beta fold hydrolase [Chloroflexota bacterium]